MATRGIHIEGDVAYLPLTKGCVAVIDAEDLPLVEGRNWHAMVQSRTAYAVRRERHGGKLRALLLHRVIMCAPDHMEVDHVNGDGLDNRRVNLRLAERSENSRNRKTHINNSSGFKGVYFEKTKGKWRAQIRAGGKKYHLGYSDTAESAHDLYRNASMAHHGAFANDGDRRPAKKAPDQ